MQLSERWLLKKTLTIVTAILGFALGSLSGWSPGIKPAASAARASAMQSGPCLHYFNGDLLGVCYNGGVFQEVFYFKDLTFEGQPIPNGSIYGLQITRITSGGGAAPLVILSAQIQPIFKVQGGSRFGTPIALDPGYLPYLTSALVAQAAGRPTP